MAMISGHLNSAADISLECLSTTLRNLKPEETTNAACVCRQWRAAVENDEAYWEEHCKDRFALSKPMAFNRKAVETWRRAFLSWQKELGEHLELARRACHVWRKIEDYAAAHFPEMLPSLRPGKSKAAFKKWKVKVAPALRVLLMIHDGQICHMQSTFERGGWPAQQDYSPSPLAGIFLGAGGGYTYYNNVEINRYLPVGPGMVYRWEGRLCAKFAEASIGSKAFEVDVRTAELFIRDMSPGCTGRLAATPPDAGNSQDGVLRWMETYANALASGMYKVEELWTGDSTPISTRKLSRGISLFPRRPPLQVEAVTRGVRVRASTVIILKEVPSSQGPSVMYAYSVRFALLPEAEQRASWPATAGPFRALTSVQLRARHWIIRDLQGEVTGEFGGEALLGGHPILTAGGEEYVYQSCIDKNQEGSMEGEFTCVEGTLARPGPEFNAVCPRFYLRVPEYIY